VLLGIWLGSDLGPGTEALPTVSRTIVGSAYLWQLAVQRCQCVSQLLLGRRPSCAEVDAQRAVFGGAAGLSGAAEYIPTPCDLKVDETRADDRQLELSFQESTSNSTSPQVDLLSGALGHRVLDQDVADLEPTAWLEHARHLRKPGLLVGHEVEHAVADDDVRPTIANW
jgi:hypothetical protein